MSTRLTDNRRLVLAKTDERRRLEKAGYRFH
jgi:hypothetical protein